MQLSWRPRWGRAPGSTLSSEGGSAFPLPPLLVVVLWVVLFLPLLALASSPYKFVEPAPSSSRSSSSTSSVLRHREEHLASEDGDEDEDADVEDEALHEWASPEPAQQRTKVAHRAQAEATPFMGSDQLYVEFYGRSPSSLLRFNDTTYVGTSFYTRVLWSRLTEGPDRQWPIPLDWRYSTAALNNTGTQANLCLKNNLCFLK